MRIIFAGIALAVLYVLITTGVARAEKRECDTWKKQSTEYAKWYWADWQKEQCGISK